MGLDKFFNDAASVITVISFLTFIGIMWWSYSPRRKMDFAEAANLPFADEDESTITQATEKNHG
jgi:cytochrome c oxidase cbb3-type subunit 4